ncbi:phosphorylase family protein [Modestobacter sp. URMC 112]
MAELYHLGVDVAAVPPRVLLVGPDVVLDGSLARWGAVPAAGRREYTSSLVDRSGHRVLVVQVGVGAPPLAIAVEELARAGAREAVLVGTADGLPSPGAVLVPTGAVREDGTTGQYAPRAYPAVPDTLLRAGLAGRLGNRVVAGLVRSVDVPDPAGEHPLVLATDLLCAALFVVAAARQVRAAAALVDAGVDPGTSAAVTDAALETLTDDRSSDDRGTRT